MQEKIAKELELLEKNQGITIVYACESGSRAWGFPSPDSDYDVRFIYVQSPNRYLSIYDRKDAIDLFLAEDMDVIGWDIRKALRLFHKSNASLFEWMQSPIVYKQEDNFITKLRELANEYFSPRAGLYHYLGMTKHTYLGHLQSEKVKIKKYFYAIRPLLCAKWIIERRTYPPIQFKDLLELVSGNRAFQENIEGLLERKKLAQESEEITPIPFFQEFIETEMSKCEEHESEFPKVKPDVEKLNDLFRIFVMK